MILPNRAPIGHVEELVVDMVGQKVHYAVVNFDHGWIGSEKRVTFPLHSLQLARADKDDLVLDVDRAKVASTPGFEKSDYRRLNDRELMTRVDRHLSFYPDSGQVKTSAADTAGRASGSGLNSGATAQTDLRTQPQCRHQRHPSHGCGARGRDDRDQPVKQRQRGGGYRR